MTPKSLGILAAVTLLVVVAAILLVPKDPNGIPSRGQRVLPGLMERINEVHGFTVETAGARATVVREDDRWVVKEKEGYPAAMEKVRPFLIGLAELTILEPTTSDPAQYAKLGLQDVAADGSSSTLVTLRESGGATMASLVIGDRRAARGGPPGDEVYVRRPDEPQTWLALGRIRAEAAPGAWMDREILDIDLRRVRRVRVTHPDGETITIHKEAGASDFVLADVPETAEVKSQFAINQIAEAVARLTLDDAVPASETAPAPKGWTEVVLETADGLRVRLRLWERQGDHHVAATAEFDERLVAAQEETTAPESPEGGTPPGASPPAGEADGIAPEQVRQEAERLQRTLSEWVYVIPAFKAEAMAKRRDVLLAVEGAG